MSSSSYFSHLPSSPDDPDIDAIISEATDLCILEQIAALNTAHLADSILPTHLESRFKKLKSFPLQEKQNMEDFKPEIIISNPSPKHDNLNDLKELREDERRSPSPTGVLCCFGCSPKKAVQRRKGKNCEEIFLNFGVSSMKEQRKKLEKVLKEQERASREVEKMVEVMEESAARLNVESLDELFSGDGDEELM